MLWRPKKKGEPTEGCSGRAGVTRSETARGLTDLEQQRKRGPKTSLSEPWPCRMVRIHCSWGVGRLREGEESVWRRRGRREGTAEAGLCKACLGQWKGLEQKVSSGREQAGLWKALNAKLANLNRISQILESGLKLWQMSNVMNCVWVCPKHFHISLRCPHKRIKKRILLNNV